ncbi:hypothetical protein PENTCL1PPCAC_27082, partial [Pristionchus entomophagus]
MHPQSLSTLAEERREDGDGEGVVNAPFSSSDHRQKTSSRLSLASWFGFSGVNGNGKEERAWRPLGVRAARGEETNDPSNNGIFLFKKSLNTVFWASLIVLATSSSRSHRHFPSTSSSFSSSRTSVSTAPPGLTGADERPHRVHSFTTSSTVSGVGGGGGGGGGARTVFWSFGG